MKNSTFKRLINRMGLEPKVSEKEKFNEWLKKIGNIYYSDNERMCKAYERIIEN